MKSKEWTTEEDNILKENYPIYGIKYCLTKLNRTKRASQQRRVKLGIPTQSQIKPKYYKENLEKIVKDSKTYKECLIKLGIKNIGSSYNTLKKYIKKYDLDISHFKNDINDLILFNKIPIEDILVKHSTYNRTRLKERLYEEGYKNRICELCGQGEEWNGMQISLILDHINGVNNDNRLKNLRIVCPNCNAGLPTHCRGNRKPKESKKPKKSKKYYCKCGNEKYRYSKECIKCRSKSQRKVKNRPSLDQLLKDIEETSYVKTGEKYGVSDNTIRKWIKFYQN